MCAGNYTYEEYINTINLNSYSQAFVTISRFYYHNHEFCYLESTEQASIASQVWPNYLGDPAFTMLSPIDQYVHDIEFITLPSSRFPSNFISITVSEEYFDSSSILLDGVPVDCEWRAICNGSTIYCFLHAELIVGYTCTTAVSSDYLISTQHNVNHSDPEGLLSVISCGYSLSPSRGYAYLTGHVLRANKHRCTSFTQNVILIELIERAHHNK